MARLPLPPGTRLTPDAGLRFRNDGRILIGGSPLRVLRLTEAGAAAVRRWLRGETPSSAGSVALSRRLVDAGMVHPEPPLRVAAEPDTDAVVSASASASTSTDDGADADARAITVVIPVRDDEEGLLTTLSGLGAEAVVVVDDGSITPVEPLVADVMPTAVVVRHEEPGGPGPARQAGLELVANPVVAFVDAGVEVQVSHLHRLGRWFADPELVAVAPRVAAAPGDDAVADYEIDGSPIDLGPEPGPVGPGRAISYLPTACLLARKASVDTVGGFDPELRYGEDVDLVWRLGRLGGVRYDPSVVVRHRSRPDVMALARQRFGYGSSAGPLARRHGAELAPVRMSGWSAAVIALALLGRAGTALGLGAATAVLLARKLDGVVPDHRVEATLLTARGHTWAALSAAEAGTRVWWPLPMVAALLGWTRPLRAAWAIRVGRQLLMTSGPLGRRVRHALFGAVDDVSYGSGVWVGAVRHRSPWALLPRFINWPDD